MRLAIDTQPLDDLNERLAAYLGADPGDDDPIPTRWTPEYVVLRLVKAFDAVHRGVSRPGPKQFGSNWPSIVQNFEELVDWEEFDRSIAEGRSWKAQRLVSDARREIEDQRIRDAEEAEDRPARPNSLDIDKADEAILWCARYLGADPLRADALQLHAFCIARNLKTAKVLRRRAVKADLLLERRRKDERDPEARKHIGRRDVMPNRVFTQQRMDLVRKEAAATIARALNKARVMVR